MPAEPGVPPLVEAAGAQLLEHLAALRSEHEQLFAQLAASERRFRGLAKAVWRVQEEERRRLARDLHDDLGQTLTALKIRLDLLRTALPKAVTPAAGEAPGATTGPAVRLASGLDEAIALAADALDKTRRLSHLLRPRVLDDLGLAAALEWLARSLGEWTGFEVRLHHAGLDPRPPADLETLAYRIVQEGLNNALKHSGVHGAQVRAVAGEGRLSLSIQDQGRGFDPAGAAAASGFGLTSLYDRVTLFHGRLRILSAPGAGVTLEAELPLAAGEP